MTWDPGVVTSAGTKLYIGTTATNPVGDTYAEFGKITDLGTFGRVYKEILFEELGSRATLKFKGTYNDGTLNLKVGRDLIDAGQAAANTALDSDLDYNFKLTLNDSSGTTGALPSTFYFKAKVMTFTTNVGTPNQVVAGEVMVSIKSGSIQLTPPT